jgi:hypothetical protein
MDVSQNSYFVIKLAWLLLAGLAEVSRHVNAAAGRLLLKSRLKHI